MVARDLRYVVLSEDSAHGNFVRRWLLAEGVDACDAAGPRFVAFLQRAPSDTDLPSLTGSRVEAARLA